MVTPSTAIQILFQGHKLHTGAVAARLGGADVSWIVGLLGTAAIYPSTDRPRRSA